MTLTQRLCYNSDGSNNPDCCTTSTLKNGARSEVCSSWSGSHLSSQGCIQVRTHACAGRLCFADALTLQYGVSEVEAAFDLPADGGANVFFGSVRALFLCASDRWI